MISKSNQKKILLSVNIFFVLAMFIAISGSAISPLKFIIPIYFILAFPFIVIVNIFYALFWISFRKWYFLISLIALLISSKFIATAIPINFHNNENTDQPNNLVIVSYNTMQMGNSKKYIFTQGNEVIKYLLSTDADIICLQEYFVNEDHNLLTQNDIDSLFSNYPYKYIKFDSKDSNRKTGLATFSKYPIIRNEEIQYTSIFNASVYSDIVVNKDTIRIINNHLESNLILGHDLLRTKDLEKKFSLTKLINTSKNIAEKLAKANPIRANQADSVKKVIESTHYKLIVCGDFNDVPNSYSYTSIKGDLKDAFVNSNTGLGWTFNASIYKLRLDYVFYDENFEVKDFKVGKTYASDHFPVRCVLEMK